MLRGTRVFRFLFGLRAVIPFTLGVTGVPIRIFAPLQVLDPFSY